MVTNKYDIFENLVNVSKIRIDKVRQCNIFKYIIIIDSDR